MGGAKVSLATLRASRVVEEMDPKKLIEALSMWVRWRARGLLLLLALAGYGRARVICGYRTLERCVELYGLGRTAEELMEVDLNPAAARPGEETVTWILPQYNRHHRRRAVDIDLTMYNELNVEAIDQLAESVGMRYGGVWSVRDTYHFEV